MNLEDDDRNQERRDRVSGAATGSGCAGQLIWSGTDAATHRSSS